MGNYLLCSQCDQQRSQSVGEVDEEEQGYIGVGNASSTRLAFIKFPRSSTGEMSKETDIIKDRAKRTQKSSSQGSSTAGLGQTG